MSFVSNLSLIHANFFFVDIVGLSDPAMSTKAQIKKIEMLNKSIMKCEVFKQTPREMLVVLPTGDGMAIGFLQGPELPLKLAMELHTNLDKYNIDKIPSEMIRVRVGLHNGDVFVVNDVLNNKNIWGPGIIIARRVMDIGNDRHILLSGKTAEELMELSDDYKRIIKPLHDYTIKHGQTMLIYSAYGDGFGNPNPPVKASYERSDVNKETIKLKKTALYPVIELSMHIKDVKSMLVHYTRTYQIDNIGDDPIPHVLHGITTDVDKTFDDLKIKVYDEKNRSLKISSISIDRPRQKEFTTIFNEPIKKGDKGRYYTLEYEVEEPNRYLENAFLVNCERFLVTFDYPMNMKAPIIYEIYLETEEKKKSKVQPSVTKGGKGRHVARWVTKDITPGVAFRFEW